MTRLELKLRCYNMSRNMKYYNKGQRETAIRYIRRASYYMYRRSDWRRYKFMRDLEAINNVISN